MTILFVLAALYALVQCVGAWKVHQRAKIARADRAQRWQKVMLTECGDWQRAINRENSRRMDLVQLRSRKGA